MQSYSRAIDYKDIDQIHLLTFQKSIDREGGDKKFKERYSILLFQQPDGLRQTSLSFEMIPKDRFVTTKETSSVIIKMDRRFADQLDKSFTQCKTVTDYFIAISTDNGEKFKFAPINNMTETEIQELLQTFNLKEYGLTNNEGKIENCR